MKRLIWIVLDFVLAMVVAVLGNIVASYLQEQLSLTDPVRFTFVVILFVVCLGVLLFVTLKRAGIAEKQDRGNDPESIRVRQRVKHVKRKGEVVGVDSEESALIPSASIEQAAKKVDGSVIGVRIGRSGEGSADEQEDR
jgi:predicted PurR-regulated permease PerM